MTSDRDRARFEAELAEKGWSLMRRTLYTPSGDRRVEYLVVDPDSPEPIATGSTWREAASIALDRPAF